MFDVHFTILHAPNCRTLKKSRTVCSRVLGFHRLITSQHFTHTPRCSTLNPPFFRGPFLEDFFFPGTILTGIFFPWTFFPRDNFSRDFLPDVLTERFKLSPTNPHTQTYPFQFWNGYTHTMLEAHSTIFPGTILPGTFFLRDHFSSTIFPRIFFAGFMIHIFSKIVSCSYKNSEPND